MPSVDVACFGEILWDVFEAVPRGSEPIGRLFRRELGGAPANVATGLARLGLRASVVGGVGRDRFGDALIAHLRSDGVVTRFVARLPQRTGLAFVTRDARGEPAFLFYRHETADVSITRAHVAPPAGLARWALVGTSTLMTPSLAGATAAFARSARRHGARLVVDLNVRAHLWPSRRRMHEAIAGLAASADLVKASTSDLAALAPSDGEAWLARHAPGATWLLTRGRGPASAVGAHGRIDVPAHRVRCVDATGGGDAFLAGALAVLVAAGARPGTAAWTDPRVFRAALEVGHILASKAVSDVGAVRGLTGLEEAGAWVAAISLTRDPLRAAPRGPK